MSKGYLSEKKVGTSEYGGELRRGWMHKQIMAFYLMIYDIIAVNFSYFMGLWLRFDLRFTQIPREYLDAFVHFAPVYTLFTLFVFAGLHLYRSIWKFASFNELNRILAATVLTTAFHVIGITALEGRMPASYYVFGPVIQVMLVTGVRFGYRYITLERSRRQKNGRKTRNAMIIGAGNAGQIVLRRNMGWSKSCWPFPPLRPRPDGIC